MDLMQTRPKKGKGERFLECRYYDDCLDFAGLQNWKNFNCEFCNLYQTIFKKTEGENQVKGMSRSIETQKNTRICEECNKNKTISPKHSLCASCMAIRSHKARSGKKKDPVKPKSKKTIHDKAKPEKPQKGHDTALTIEFGKYASVLNEIEKVAEEEVRSVDLQVIYILKKYLKNVHVT